MSAAIFRLLTTDRAETAAHQMWLELGQPVVIGPKLVMTFFADCQDGEWEPVIQLKAPTAEFSAPLPVDHRLNAEAWAGVHIVPVALRLSIDGRPLQVLVRFEGRAAGRIPQFGASPA